MTSSIARSLFAALLLTLGLAICVAAMAYGQADDAPGLGLIGLGSFCAFAFAAFRLNGRLG